MGLQDAGFRKRACFLEIREAVRKNIQRKEEVFQKEERNCHILLPIVHKLEKHCHKL